MATCSPYRKSAGCIITIVARHELLKLFACVVHPNLKCARPFQIRRPARQNASRPSYTPIPGGACLGRLSTRGVRLRLDSIFRKHTWKPHLPSWNVSSDAGAPRRAKIRTAETMTSKAMQIMPHSDTAGISAAPQAASSVTKAPRPCVNATSVSSSLKSSVSTIVWARPSLTGSHVTPASSLAKAPSSVPT